jgi:hypothetical protein
MKIKESCMTKRYQHNPEDTQEVARQKRLLLSATWVSDQIRRRFHTWTSDAWKTIYWRTPQTPEEFLENRKNRRAVIITGLIWVCTSIGLTWKPLPSFLEDAQDIYLNHVFPRDTILTGLESSFPWEKDREFIGGEPRIKGWEIEFERQNKDWGNRLLYRCKTPIMPLAVFERLSKDMNSKILQCVIQKPLWSFVVDSK